MTSTNEEFCLEIKTVQSSTIKVLVEALKEILTDTVLEITEEYIKICTMDSSHIILIHLKLYADKFEQPRRIYTLIHRHLRGADGSTR